MSLLEVNDINVYYGAIHAIKGISFSVDEGEVVTLIGANGAGKSTTLSTVAGLLRPREGSIHFGGKDLARVHASDMVKHGMALCPEGRRIFQQMTVLENLEMGGFTRPDKEIPGSIEQMFELFPRLKERQKQIAGTLSGGEQQMLAMGRADAGCAVNGPCADSGRADFRHYPRAAQERHDDSAGGTERANGIVRREPRVCAGNGQDFHVRRRAGTAAQRCSQEGVSGGVMPSSREGGRSRFPVFLSRQD